MGRDVDGGGVLGALAQAQRSGQVTASQLTRMALDRIDRAAHLNAVVTLDGTALLEADAVDQRRSRGERLGPLAGVPVLVKDNMNVRGLPTTQGSLLCADASPALGDDAVVARLRRADAVIVGKTNLSEFAMEAISDNKVFGPTHNPWRVGTSPGGSSGGSAAAMAAGLVPVATGTDGGGSVRIPAALCGLLGLKPSSGVTGAHPARLPLEMSSAGILSATVADLRVLAAVLLGPTHGDPSCVYEPSSDSVRRPLNAVFATRRIAGEASLPAEIESAFTNAVEAFGHAVQREVQWLPAGIVDSGADEVWASIYAPEDVFAVGPDMLRRGYGQLDLRVRGWVDRGLNASLEEYLAARHARNGYVLRVDELLGEANVLLSPTVAVGPYPVTGPSGIDGHLMPIDLFNTAVLNLTGHPGLSVPAGYVDDVPFGLQLVGPRGSDLWLVEVARLWERLEPWPLCAPGYEAYTTAAC